MNLTGVTAVSADATAAASSTELAANMETFLTMLTTQLENQDPLDPTDSSEFTNQLVQFSQVEQQINTNENLENIVDVNASTVLSAALAYVGLDVETLGSNFSVEDGEGAFTYVLSEEAETVTVQILDDKGNTVRNFDSDETSSGRHSFTWDGKDENGTELGDGIYQVVVTYTNSEGDTAAATTLISGEVTGMEMYEGEPILLLGDVPVQMVDVVSALSENAPKTATDSTAITSSTSTSSSSSDEETTSDDT